jgi:histidinol-phosphate/aromatic aminotransferase/cobyric acid decarboxylase-like protein
MLALDGSVSPYLPTQEILDALGATSLQGLDVAQLARMLRERLAMLHGISIDRIALLPNDASRLDQLIALRPNSPLAVYSPSGLDPSACQPVGEVIDIPRSKRFRIESPQIEETPLGCVALVVTPNDPTGNAISLTTAAQLARRAGLLVLDERSAEMQRRSMIPLVEEFDSIVLMRSFSDWAGLGTNAPAYVITTSEIAESIDRSADLCVHGLHGALAAVSNAAKLDAVAQRVRLERLRLYRMLRKLNFLAPYPSDSGYVLATITRGDRETIAHALSERGIAVYCPQHIRLRQTLRFTAISPVATRKLQIALVDICRTVLD